MSTKILELYQHKHIGVVLRLVNVDQGLFFMMADNHSVFSGMSWLGDEAKFNDQWRPYSAETFANDRRA